MLLELLDSLQVVVVQTETKCERRAWSKSTFIPTTTAKSLFSHAVTGVANPCGLKTMATWLGNALLVKELEERASAENENFLALNLMRR